MLQLEQPRTMPTHVGLCMGNPELGVPLVIRRQNGSAVFTTPVDELIPAEHGVFARTSNRWYFVDRKFAASRF